MTSEQRLDRLERIAKLFVKAGLRPRRNMREMDTKLNILINLQIQNEEKFAQNEERFARSEERYEERFAKLAESQARTDRKLGDLIDIIREGRNGNSRTGNS